MFCLIVGIRTAPYQFKHFLLACPGKMFGSGVLQEQGWCDQINSLVGTLGRQNNLNNQLILTFIAQFFYKRRLDLPEVIDH